MPVRNMGSPKFPLEVMGMIIDWVALSNSDDSDEESYQTLVDLRLVCKNFVGLATPHIFQHLKIRFDEEGEQHLGYLERQLERDPKLAKYVQEVTCITELRYEDSDTVITPSQLFVVELLPYLPNLRSLHWYRFGDDISFSRDMFDNHWAVHWREKLTTIVIGDTQEPIQLLPLFLIPNLVKLQLEKCCCKLPLEGVPKSHELVEAIKAGRPISNIRHFVAKAVTFDTPILISLFFPNVERMHLSNIKSIRLSNWRVIDAEWTDLVAYTPTFPFSYKKLEKLEALGSVDYLMTVGDQRSTTHKQMPALKRLEFVHADRDDFAFCRRISAHLDGLEFLRFGDRRRNTKDMHTHSTGLRFHPMCTIIEERKDTLKNIILDRGFHEDEETTVQALRALCGALQAIIKNNVLEGVTVDIFYDRHDGGAHARLINQWWKLATLLGNEKNFPHLRTVDVMVVCVCGLRDEEDCQVECEDAKDSEPVFQDLRTTRIAGNNPVNVLFDSNKRTSGHDGEDDDEDNF